MNQSAAITLILTGISVLGLAGVIMRVRLGRTIVWLLSLAVSMVGLLALGQGGIAEPFSQTQMWSFCAVTFWPVLGCAVGEALTHRRERDGKQG